LPGHQMCGTIRCDPVSMTASRVRVRTGRPLYAPAASDGFSMRSRPTAHKRIALPETRGAPLVPAPGAPRRLVAKLRAARELRRRATGELRRGPLPRLQRAVGRAEAQRGGQRLLPRGHAGAAVVVDDPRVLEQLAGSG